MLSRTTQRLVLTCLFLAFVTTTRATPVSLAKRDPVITYDSSGAIANVTDPTTMQEIVQGSATDGGGEGFNVTAIVWFAWSLAVGVPLMLGGIRLSRLTTGAAIGSAGVVCIWASFVNAFGAGGISDVLLMILSMAAFACGFVIGVFNFGRAIGIASLGAMGGLSIGVRIILFRPGLLIPSPFWANWLIIAVLGAATFLLTILKQRASIVIGSAAYGTFLTFLGIDLIINKQSGMSMGLRHLFDTNSAHIKYMREHHYSPPISTEVLLGVSLALIPILAYAQHRIFKQPFKRVRSWTLDSRTSVENDDATLANRPSEAEKVPLKEDHPPEDTPETPTATPAGTTENLLSPREDTPFKRALSKSARA